MTATRPRPATIVLWLVLTVLAFVQVYLLLHEGGHALAAVAVGGTVRTVDARPWSTRPHASYDLDDVTDGQRAFVSAGGTLLPLAAWAAAVVASPRTLPPLVALVRSIVSLGILAGLAPWIVLPWPALHASAPGDDVVRFAQKSGWPPALIAGLALAGIVGGVVLLARRWGLWTPWRQLRASQDVTVPKRTLWITAAALVASVALAVGLNAAYPARNAVELPGYPPIADVTLTGASFDGRFGSGVSDGTPVRLVLGFEDVVGGPFRIVLTDASGAEHGLARFDAGTTMGMARSQPQLDVPQGPWRVRLIADDTVGRFRVWTLEDPVAPPAR